MTFVADLEPKPLWAHFDAILTIPRPSKGEEKMREYVLGVASELGLEHQKDAAGNVVVRCPATAGKEDLPVTILQSHLDMVQEKHSDLDFDFASDAIQPVRDGAYLKADGTTLGSDNGIGVASMLALMHPEEGRVHGPLELLFTIDEESGLTGAMQLDASMLHGRRLINLDSEEEGALCVGCAGGADSSLSLPLQSVEGPDATEALRLRLHGLKGGHSGVDIHLQRGNAIQLLARALYFSRAAHPFLVSSLEGGNAHNAIPREATATIVVSADAAAAVRDRIEEELAAIRDEYKPAEPGLAWQVDPAVTESAWDEASSGRLLEFIVALPHGVQSMSYDIPGLVETSTNLATVRMAETGAEIQLSSRSSVASALAALRRRIRAMAELAGATVEEAGGYPGWKPDMDSELLRVVRAVHERELGSAPEVGAIHAGLECGLIGEMVPGMDMISIGPQIEFPHSPDERVKVDSVGRFWTLLTSVLEELAA